MPVLRRVSGAGTPRRLLQNRMQESALSVKADGEHQSQRHHRRVEYTAETEEEGGGMMTREEHIENLKAIASDMPSDKCADWIESLMAGVKALEQEPCADMVSRQAVLDLPRIKTHNVWGNVIYESVDVDAVRQLPPVTPQPKMGKWVKTIGENGVTSAIRCSGCGFEDNRYELFNYCPNCGSKNSE